MSCALNIHNVDVLITKHLVLCHQCHGISLGQLFLCVILFS